MPGRTPGCNGGDRMTPMPEGCAGGAGQPPEIFRSVSFELSLRCEHISFDGAARVIRSLPSATRPVAEGLRRCPGMCMIWR